jgi:phosphoribosylpyrophosphate synthetase
LRPELKQETKKIHVLSVGPLLAETIRRLHTGESVAKMKDDLQHGQPITSARL